MNNSILPSLRCKPQVKMNEAASFVFMLAACDWYGMVQYVFLKERIGYCNKERVQYPYDNYRIFMKFTDSRGVISFWCFRTIHKSTLHSHT